MIAEYLHTGKDNPRTARELADIIGCSQRDISAGVEHERRQGQPICASCDARKPGYYLAETADELQNYCKGLFKRAGEIHKTRRALLETAQTLPAEEPAEPPQEA